MNIKVTVKKQTKIPAGLDDRRRLTIARMTGLGKTREEIVAKLEELDKEYRSRKATPEQPVCKRCHLYPHEILEFIQLAEEEEYTSATEAVIEEEGTYNPKTGWFYCTDCYIKEGQPKGKA